MLAMANHPNRSKGSPAANPTPEAIRALRESLLVPDAYGQLRPMTQTDAARVIYASMRAWQEWEAGTRRMHPGLWELFQIKTEGMQRKDA